MTCEVAVMNKRGVALAADSAVTLGEAEKIYHTAEKLFRLSARAPVGIMTYDSADIMGVPWETVIKLYRENLGERPPFEQLEQYAQDFLRFIEGASNLFPESNQREWFRSVVRSYWIGEFLQPLMERLQNQRPSGTKHVHTFLVELIEKNNKDWQDNTEAIEDLGAAYGDRVLSEYGTILDELEKELFGNFKLTNELRQGLRTNVRFMYTQKAFHPQDRSGIVVSGFGEAEPFPVLVHYLIGAVAAGKLRFFKVNEARITYEQDAWVLPLAQSKMIEMFYEGIHPDLREDLMNIMVENVRRTLKKSGKTIHQDLTDKLVRKVQHAFEEALKDKYKTPLTKAVSALPRQELAELAEALVRLTVFKVRMAIGEHETVAGPIDVAVISKGDGFIWVRRKNLVGQFRENAQI